MDLAVSTSICADLALIRELTQGSVPPLGSQQALLGCVFPSARSWREQGPLKSFMRAQREIGEEEGWGLSPLLFPQWLALVAATGTELGEGDEEVLGGSASATGRGGLWRPRVWAAPHTMTGAESTEDLARGFEG